MNGEESGLRMDEVYEEYFPMIYNYVFCRLMHREDTEDVVSHVFMKVNQHLERFDSSKASLKTWIFRITENALIDFYRTHSRKYSNEYNYDRLDDVMHVHFDEQYEQMLSPTRQAILDAMLHLQERERTFIYCRYYLRVSNREIAKSLSMNESTVAAILMRARRKLGKILQQHGWSPEETMQDLENE